LIALPLLAQAQSASDIAAGATHFELRCGGCHGGDGKGGERAPDIVTPGIARRRSAEEVRELITKGLPDVGMPALNLPENELNQIVAFYRSLTAPASEAFIDGDPKAGESYFSGAGNCKNCHTRGPAAKMVGPDLSSVGSRRTLGEIRRSVSEPSEVIARGYDALKITLRDGRTVEGFARNESTFDFQTQTFEGRFEIVERSAIAKIDRRRSSPMPKTRAEGKQLNDLLAYLSRLTGEPTTAAAAPPLPGAVPFDRILKPNPGDWPTYNGRLHGNRHSTLSQINTSNVKSIAPKWVFPVRSPRSLEMTPIVVDGIMYVTAVNEMHAIDARNGREIWDYSRPRTPGVMGDAGTGANRGAAILGDRVFMVTDTAHMIALDRLTGRLLWDTEMGDYKDHYGGTLSPLVVKNLVIGGVGGGDEGIRGFLAAYDAATGKEVWRFWTVPLPGEPLSETWIGSVLPHGCAGTWLTGTFDPELNLLYWPTGNPCPDMNGDERKGDNLYSDSILALDIDTGKLKWYYQYTPHDLYDWDGNQTPLLLDAEFNGRPRKLLAQASRNGFFYVLDRTSGELLMGKPFVDKLSWATGIGPDGRPKLVPGKEPTPGGNVVCPSLAGATNWMSPAYHPGTGLFYVQATEQCQIFTKRDEAWQRGRGYFGGAANNIPGEPEVGYLRALDLKTGAKVWEIRQSGGQRSWGGALSTEGGLVFYGDASGAFAAADAKTGELLWNFHANEQWKASPMTYTVDGKQYIAVASGLNVIAFALPGE
jgi:PQQ-dependent dehydrogenase (methanol/ethanol family)